MSNSTAHGASVAAWWPWVVLPAVASALVSTGLLFAALDEGTTVTGETWANVPLAIGFSTVAAGIWSTRPEPGGLRRLAVLYTVVGLASAATLPAHGWGRADLSGADAATWVSEWVWALGAAPILGLGLLLYPDGRLPGRAWWPAALLGGLGTAGLVAGGMIGSDRVGDLAFPVVMVAAVIGVLALAVRFRRARVGSDTRAQVGGFVVAGVVLVVVAVLPVSGSSATVLALVAGAGLPVTVGWAVVRHRLLDRQAEMADLTRRLGVVSASRRTLVEEREQERMELRRELHDGLGPFLAAIGLGLRQLESRAAHDDAELVHSLADEAQRAVAEVRRICAGLRPETLDQLGLASALAAGVAPLERLGPDITLTVDDELPPLPPAVEVAAYRIALEATTNAVRHGSPSRVQLDIDYEDGVRLRVSDDGTGIPAGRTTGVGLPGMTDRAEEVGGWLRVAPREPRGTCVEAWLPVTADG